eukprot:4189995-Amphidinium_carterae.1
MDIGVEEGYVPTEVVEVGEDAQRPSTPQQGSRDPDGVPGLWSRAGCHGGASRSDGPVDRIDPWSGASAASVAQAVEAVTNWVQPQMQRAMPLPSEVNPWLRFVCSGPRPLMPVVLPFQPLAALSIPAPLVPSEPIPRRVVLPRVGVKRKTPQNWAMAVDEARLAALSSWEQILMFEADASTVGKQLKADDGMNLAIETLGDTVADKATGTPRIRCLDFGRF